MSNTIASQLVSHDFPRLTAIISKLTLEERLSGIPIPDGLQIHIDHFAILIYGSPEIMLFAMDLHKYFIDVECVAITLMSLLFAPGIFVSELNAP